jgi:23S rRNA (cytosine1962-C5)-methyltransferase
MFGSLHGPFPSLILRIVISQLGQALCFFRSIVFFEEEGAFVSQVTDYQLIDSGREQKFERFGKYTFLRPCLQAIWCPCKADNWQCADALFSREKESGWRFYQPLPASWTVEIGGVRFLITPTDFGHLGVFPEHAFLWQTMRLMVVKGMRLLNLFAYSGGITFAAAQAGAEVCHLDASKGMGEWARQNAVLNQLDKAPIRWIVDDAFKFLKREKKRKSLYEAIVLDPPTFGRGRQGEVFKIETDLIPLLELCRDVLSENWKFIILSCHTPGFTPLVLQHVMKQIFYLTSLETGEMTLQSSEALPIPSGCYAICTRQAKKSPVSAIHG